MYRRFNASYSLWEGSDIDLDELVTAAAARSATASTVASLAEKHVQPRPLVARRHSFQTGTLRFFSIRFATPKSISDASAVESYGDADGVVFVVLPEHSEEVQAALNAVSSKAWAVNPRVVFGVATDPSALAAALRNYALLQDVQHNTPALAGDAAARLELRARIMATRQQVDKAVSEILDPSVARNQHCRWFYRGKRLDFSTQRELNDRLSVICDRVFHKTPRIKNELINRRELSSAAAAARRNLIEAMITKGDQSELGITGTPPEKSMYLSLLATTGLHRRSRGKYGFHAPGKDSDQGIQAIWEAMHRCFVESDAVPKNVSELFDLLQSPPFGVKAGLVPVLFCAAILVSDTEVAIYEEGSFVPQLTIAMFERLLKAPSRFSLQRWTITGIRTRVFDRLAQLLLPKDESPRRPATQILSVVRPLCRFASTLNEYSRNTSSLSPESRSIRDTLLRATKPDQLLFSELPIACGLPPFRAKPSKDSEAVDQFIAKLKAGLDELRGTYERLLHDVGCALGQPFELSGDLKQVRNTLIQRGKHIQSFVADPKLKSFVGRLIDEALPDDAWVESVAAVLTQRPPAVWKDEDRARLEVVLTSMARLFRHVEAIAFNAPNASVEDHAVRIGITTKHSAELEYVIRVSPTEQPYMESVQKSILAALGDAALNGHAETTVAALISVAQQLLNK